MTSDHVYKIVELVGSSPEGIEQAVENAVSRASQTLSDLDWFEVKEIRGNIHEGKIQWYQVKMDIGFRVLDPAELGRD